MAGSKRQSANNPRPRSAKAQPRHDEIIAAAALLFYEKGFEATTTQDIAERVGMLKGSLYYYIESKDEMLLEIIERIHSVYLANVEAINKIEGSALDKTWAFVYRLVVANAVNYIGSAVFFNEFRSLRDEQQQRIITMRDTHEAMLRDLLSDGIGSGVMCDRLDPKLTATATLTMCNAIYRWFRPEGEWAPEFIARTYADLVISQIACNPTIHKFHGAVDREGLIERLHALSLLPSIDARVAG